MTLLNRASLSANRNRLFWSLEALSRILTKERISKALAMELSGKEESAHKYLSMLRRLAQFTMMMQISRRKVRFIVPRLDQNVISGSSAFWL